MGVTENISRIGTIRELEQGRHLVQQDVDQARRVAVVGMDLVDALFGSVDPMGKQIDVDGHKVKVVGVAEAKGTVFGKSQDNFIWMPDHDLPEAVRVPPLDHHPGRGGVDGRFEEAQDQVRLAMRNRRHLTYHKDDDFAIETGESIMELWQTATRGIYVVTIVVTGISLLIGGIVVMNIMLVSVTERIQEIGIRKALGARRRDILRQFLVESVVLSGFGGLLGVLGATAIALGLASPPRRHDGPRLLGPGAPVGGGPRPGGVLGGGPRGRSLPGEPGRRPRPRRRAPERVMLAALRRFASRHHVLLGIWEAMGMGLQGIRAYKMRAFLTILGVVMGIMTVTGMSSIVAGLNASMARQIATPGLVHDLHPSLQAAASTSPTRTSARPRGSPSTRWR